MYNRSSWGRVLGLGCLVAVLAIGPIRIMEFLYAWGLYPPVTESEVVAALERQGRRSDVTCEPDVDDWDYVCKYTYRNSSGMVSRHREGIRTSWLTPIGSSRPLDPPIPISSDSGNAGRTRGRDRRSPGAINLRTASVEDLRRVPFVDPYLAQQIRAGVRAGLITSVDDLRKLQDIDERRLDAIRARVRWE